MREMYEAPVAELVEVEVQDVIMTSDDFGDVGESGDDE